MEEKYFDVCAVPSNHHNSAIHHDNQTNITLILCENQCVHVYLNNRVVCILELAKREFSSCTISSVAMLSQKSGSNILEVLICTDSGDLFLYPLDVSELKGQQMVSDNNGSSQSDTLNVDVGMSDDDLFSDDFDLSKKKRKAEAPLAQTSAKKSKLISDISDEISFAINLNLSQFNLRIIDRSHLVCSFQSSVSNLQLFVSKSKGKGRKIISLAAVSYSEHKLFYIMDLRKGLKKRPVKYQSSLILETEAKSSRVTANIVLYPAYTISEYSKLQIPKDVAFVDDQLYMYLFGRESSLTKRTINMFGFSCGQIAYTTLDNRKEISTTPLFYTDDSVVAIKLFRMSSKTPEHVNDALVVIGRSGSMYCIYKQMKEGTPYFIHRVFNIRRDVVRCEVLDTRLFVLTKLQTVITCQLMDQLSDGTWEIPNKYTQRELPIKKSALVMGQISDGRIVTVHSDGSVLVSTLLNRDEIDKHLSKCVPIEGTQLNIRQIFSQMESVQSQLDILKDRIQSSNIDIEALNYAMHILAIMQQKMNIVVNIQPVEVNALFPSSTRQLVVSLVNKTNYRFLKHWNILISIANEGSETKNNEAETYSYPLENFIIESEWKQTITANLRSYNSVKITIHLSFKMKNLEKGFTMSIYETTMNCWDFATACPDNITMLLNDDRALPTIDERLQNKLLELHTSQKNVLQRVMHTTKFQFGFPSTDLELLRLKRIMLQSKFVTHLGEVIIVQLRQVTKTEEPAIFEITLHCRQQSTLLFIRSAILEKIQRHRQANITQSDPTSIITFQEQLIELQDLISKQIRESKQGFVITSLKNIDHIYDKLISLYTRMRQAPTTI